MPSEFIGEVTVRSSSQDPIVATTARTKALRGPIGPGQVLVGPVTIRLDADDRGVMIGGSPTEPATARIHLDGRGGDITVRDHNSSAVLRFDSQFAVRYVPTLVLLDEHGWILWRHEGRLDANATGELERLMNQRLGQRGF